MVIYLIGATCTSGILLNAFLRDRSTPKTDLLSWKLLLVASLVWFIILPYILCQKWLMAEPSEQSDVCEAVQQITS